MADLIKWARDRKKEVQGVYHQVNPFDSGRTYDTNQRGVTPGTVNPVNLRDDNTPGFQWSNNSFTRGLSRGFDQVNPLDSGRSWQTRQPDAIERGKSTISQAGNIIAPATGKFINTAALAGEQVWNTGQQFFDTRESSSATKQYVDAVKSKDPVAIEAARQRLAISAARSAKTNQSIEDDYNRYATEGNGVFGAGSFFHNPEEAASGDLGTVAKRVGLGTAETMFEVGSLGVGGFVGKNAAKTVGKVGVKKAIPIIAKEQGGKVILNALLNAGQGASSVANQDADSKTILKAALLSAGLGTASDIGIGAGGLLGVAGAKKILNSTVGNTVTDSLSKTGRKIAAEVTGNPSRHPSVIALDETIKNLNIQRGKMLAGGMSENSAAVKANSKAFKLAVRERDSTIKKLGVRTQGGYLDLGAIADDASKGVKKVKKALSGKTEETPTTRAYGKTIEMTEKNGYKAIDTPDGRKIYTKTQTEGSNVKGTRGPIQRWYTEDGTKLTRAQAEAYQSGQLKQQPLKVEPEKKTFESQMSEINANVDKLTELANTQAKLARQVDKTTKLNKEGSLPSSNEKVLLQSVDQKLGLPNDEIARITGKQPKVPKNVPPSGDSRVPLSPAKLKGDKQTRFASRTVPGSPEVSDTVRKAVKEGDNSYAPGTDAAKLDASKAFIKKNGIRKATTDVKERLGRKDFDPQTASDAIEVAKALDARGTRGSMLEATEIYQQLGQKFRKSGQEVQAASLLSNRTPQGMKYQAIRTLDKAGVNVSKEISEQIDKLVGDIKKAKSGSYEDGLARYKLMEFVEKKVPSSNTSKAVQIWKAGLLTSPRTTAGNVFANSMESIFKKGYVDPVANVTDTIASWFTGKRSRSYTAKGIASGAGEGLVKGVKYFKTGYDPRNPLTKFDVRNVHFSDTPKGKVAEAYTQGVFRLMGAQDQPFYYANFRNSIADMAITEAKNKGLKGQAKRDFIKKFIEQPDKKILDLADAEARYAVFQDETSLGKLARRVKNADGVAGDIAEFVIPFSGVPSSIATRVITRTPIGAAHTIIKGIRNGTLTQRTLTKAIAEGTAVLPLAAAGAALARAGEMTLGYPKDKTERDLWESEGKQPYSIKVGDQWLSVNYFQPGGTLLAAGATYQDQIDQGEDPTKALTTAFGGAGKAVTEQSFLKGVSGALNAVTDPERAAGRFIDQTAGSITPNIVRSSATAFDDKKREVDGVLDTVKSTIPGVRQTLDVQKDMFGRDIERNASALDQLFNPTRPSNVKNADDKLTGELRRLQDTDNGITPTDLTKTAFYNSKTREGTKLTDKQVRDFNAAYGAALKPEWDKAIADPRYKALSDEDKRKKLADINDTVYGALKRQFEADNQVGSFDPNSTKEVDKLSTDERRYLEGKNIDYFDPGAGKRTPQEEYEYAQEKLNEDRGSLNDIELAQREDEVKTLGIKKDYDPVVVDLYGLNKGDVYDYVTGKGKEGEAIFEKAVEYGDKLVEAGLIDRNKFRDKYGNIKLDDGSSSKSTKKKGPWQAPRSQAISLSNSPARDNRALITGLAEQIKAPRLRRTFG